MLTKCVDCLRCLYILSCEACHLVDHCVQYQYSVHINTCLHHLSTRCPSTLLIQLQNWLTQTVHKSCFPTRCHYKLILSAVIKKGIICDAVLSPSLLFKYTCFQLQVCSYFGSDLDIHRKTVTRFSNRKKLRPNLVIFLTVQAVNMINGRNVNVAVPKNSIIH